MNCKSKINCLKESDEKGVEWIRASHVNLVISKSENEIRIYSCKVGKEIGEMFLKMNIIGGKVEGW